MNMGDIRRTNLKPTFGSPNLLTSAHGSLSANLVVKTSDGRAVALQPKELLFNTLKYERRGSASSSMKHQELRQTRAIGAMTTNSVMTSMVSGQEQRAMLNMAV